jgi:hypothetical protein
LHGENKEYYPNGVLKIDGYYSDGKKNGYVSFFDSTGTLLSKRYYYYGILVGPSIDYKDNEPTEYSFNSLDNRPLFYINYDSIKGMNIEDLQKGYIYFDIYQKADVITKKNVRKEYRLYLISPPKFRFAYALCIIKEKYQVVQEIKQFDNAKIWDTFETDHTLLAPGQTFAIRLFIDDDTNQQALGMFKKID